jgi:hypothetical protein
MMFLLLWYPLALFDADRKAILGVFLSSGDFLL